MSLGSRLRRLRGSFRNSAFEASMEAELRHHLELEAEMLARRGMSAGEARDLAWRRFGSVAQIKDECRDSWGLRAIDAFSQDARDALRSLRRHPASAAVVLLTLALGIGAATAIFSVVYAVLVQPLPYAHGERLVEIRQEAARLGVADIGVSVQELAEYRAHAASLDAVVEYHQMSFNLVGSGDAARVQTGVVSTGFFDVLGVQPALGRTFRAEDDSAGAPAVIVLSDAYWRRALGADPAIVGRRFEMNGRTHTAIGVLPPMPQFPAANDVYMPPSACPFRSDPETIANPRARMLTAIGRLRPGATLQQAQGDLDAVSQRLTAADPGEYDPPRTGFRTAALMIRGELTRRARPTLLMLLAATGFVLLLVSANVANLTLARVLGRERELAVRAALGAGPRRIARQLLTEHTILGLAGGALGLIVAWLVRDLLVAFTARFTPRADEIAIGAAVVGFTLALSVITGLASGAYAVSGLSRTVMVRLRHGKPDTTSMRSALIALQVAISFILLAGAGLLARSAIALQEVDAGFHAERVLTMRIDLDFVNYDTPASRRDFFRSVLESVQAEPGVRTAALSFDVPLDTAHTMRRELLVEGDSSRPGQALADLKFTSPDYFATIGMSLLSGRLFTGADTAETARVAVVNQSLAQHYFSGADPVGRRVSLDDGATWITIVGVVNDVRQHDLALSATDELYQPFARTGSLSATLLVGTTRDPEDFAQRIPGVVRTIDPRQAVSRVQTLQAIRGRSLEPPRLTAMLVALFAVAALVITAIGIAGVVSFSVTRRTAEIGVRMALGAPRRGVMAMLVREGLTPVAVGLAGGLLAALAMTRVSRQLLFGIEPTDPLTYAAALAALTAAASIACLIPARRAAAVDPLSALRADS